MTPQIEIEFLKKGKMSKFWVFISGLIIGTLVLLLIQSSCSDRNDYEYTETMSDTSSIPVKGSGRPSIVEVIKTEYIPVDQFPILTKDDSAEIVKEYFSTHHFSIPFEDDKVKIKFSGLLTENTISDVDIEYSYDENLITNTITKNKKPNSYISIDLIGSKFNYGFGLSYKSKNRLRYSVGYLIKDDSIYLNLGFEIKNW